MATTLKNCRNSFLVAALSMLLFADAAAQSTNQPFIISLTGGPSFPLGRFGDKSSTNWNTATDKTGAAETGWSGSLQLGYQFSTHLGIAVTAGISQYKRNEEAFKKYFESIYGNTAEVNTKDWNIVKVLAGPTYTTAISKKLLFRSGISAGIAKTAIPAFSYAVNGSGGLTYTAGTNSKIKMPAVFAYQLNAGLGYKLDQTLLLLLDMYYFDATATNKYTPFTGGPIIIGPSPQPGSTQVKEKYKLSAFSASLGIGFRF